jgi:hypothetical protein
MKLTTVKVQDIARLGHGGLCRGPVACEGRTYPYCEFGKG